MTIIFEDKNLLVVDKPAGLSVHPALGNSERTLVDLVIDKYPGMKKYSWPIDPGLPADLSAVARRAKVEALAKAGIVHRLDKDTSGLIVVAKNPETQKFLQEQFKSRTVDKRYLALVLGKVEPEVGKITADIGRDQKNRLQQRVMPMVFSWTKGKTRPAETRFKVLRYYAIPLRHPTSLKLRGTKGFAGQKTYLSFLEVKPLTGRMHQIRVHLKYLGYPIIGDQIYNTKESKKISKKLGLDHQFLHSHKLKIKLPDGSEKEFKSQLPQDLEKILNSCYLCK